MMMPEVGGIPNVSGSSSATPETGPTPGRAPMSVPRITPATAMTRLNGVNAIEKPRARLAKRSIASEPQHADRERHAAATRRRPPSCPTAVPTATPSVTRPGVALEKRSRIRSGTARWPASCRATGMSTTNSTVAPTTTDEAHERRARAAATPAPGRARGRRRTSRSAARIAMASPSQNGKKPEPGPVAPQYVYDFAARRREGHAEQQQEDRADLVGAPHAATSSSRPRSPSAFSYLPLRPSRYLLASSPVHCTGVRRLRLM